MTAKHSIKTITLYELFVNNNICVISSLCNLIIVIFNYYSIIKLTLLQAQFSEFVAFTHIIFNTIICQYITFLNQFFVIYFSNPIWDENVEKKRRQGIVIVVSYFSKLCVTIYNYNVMFGENIISFKTDDLFYNLIEFSYVPMFAFMLLILVIMVVCCLYFILITCDAYFTKMVNWSKTCNLSIIQRRQNDGCEDV